MTEGLAMLREMSDADPSNGDLLALDEPREALARLTVAERLLGNQNPSADRALPETQYHEGLVYLQLGKTHARLIEDGAPSAKSEHRQLARSWLGQAIDAMKRASVDTVHGERAKVRLRETEVALEELQIP